MIKKLSFIISFICLLNVQSQVNEELLHFNGIKDGISKTGIHFINQDHEGFIWIGTHGSGLYRYDGINYNSYRPKVQNDHRGNSSFVYSSFEDEDNNLWVSTNLGIAIYDRDQDEFNHVPLIDKNGQHMGNVGINSIYGDGMGRLYLGTSYQGIFVFDLEDYKLEKLTLANADPFVFLAINEIKANSKGTIYAASSSGLLEVNLQAKELDLAMLRNGSNAKTITTPLESMLIDKNNTLWLGSINKGIYRIKESGDEEPPSVINYQITLNNIFSLSEAPRNGILIGTENDGLYHVDEKGKIIHHYLFDKTNENSILSNSIWALYKDNNERLWMGYYNKGVAVHDKYFNKFNSIKSVYNKNNSLQTSSVTSIVSDRDQNLWVSMEGGGIDLIDRNTGEYTHINSLKKSSYQGLSSDYIQTLFIDSQNNMWVGSWDKGIFFLKNGSKRFVNYQFPILLDRKGASAVMSFTEDSNGRIWISTFNQGLYSCDLNTVTNGNLSKNSFQFRGLEGKYINKLVAGENNTIWVGTTNELLKLEQQGPNSYISTSLNLALAGDGSDPNAYYSFDIVSILKDKKGHLWLGTRGLGAVKLDVNTNKVQWYDSDNGLQMPNINGILEDDKGHIWLAGNSGLIMFNHLTGEFSEFSKNDGLLSMDFNKNAVFKEESGKLFFGGTEGIDHFDPYQIKRLKSPPNVYLKNLKVFNIDVEPSQENAPLNKSLSQTDSIVFTSAQSVFTIEYSGINFTRPEENSYAYYLEGYEDDYNYVENSRSATYTNLDTGEYIFKVKAANNDGFWNETPRTLHIKVLPPWWKTPWAIICYGLVFLGILSLWIQFEKNRLSQKQQVENERQERERKELLHEERIQFFTNVAHEFSSPLTLIINPIRDLISSNNPNLPERVKQKHFTIYKNADRLYRLINELLDFSKLESDKVKVGATRFAVIPFVKKLISHFEEESQSNDINLVLNTPQEEIWIWADKGMLEKILFNLLSNAFKVTPQGGTILLDLQKENENLELVVNDTGVGLDETELKKLFHRFYQAQPINNGFFSGTGIGLQLVHSYVTLHGGKITVQSAKGKGSSFKVVLPLENKKLKGASKIQKGNNLSDISVSIEKNTNESSDISIAPKNHRTKTLLIVEDDTELRNYLKSEFKSLYKCVLAKNGNEGFELAYELLPDVIMTDVLMPEMSGFDFCEKIRKDIRTSHIPIMMLTAKSGMLDKITGIDKGADVYLNKPFDMNLVIKHLAQLIQSREVIYNKFLRSMGDIKEDLPITSLDKLFLEKVISYVQENLSNPNLGVESLADHVNLSRSQLYRKIKGLTNQTANEFIRNQRLQNAKNLLEKGATDLGVICNHVGFSSTSYFTLRFKDYYGISPQEVVSQVKSS
ncbi:hybrid sensor histidine kinase/response regulator transcription factor [Euzebyella saccharophila]|uniref:histidine kinase n=1 Tax=Euzebyella saccharophila TaxID=679664 RepID=A0ABV8JVA2_9FLAO|nr:two-component regulator propeller domain-containing protein [Euzebyella saccharophila]